MIISGIAYNGYFAFGAVCCKFESCRPDQKAKSVFKKPIPILSARMKTPRQRVISGRSSIGRATIMYRYSFYPLFIWQSREEVYLARFIPLKS